MSEPRELDLRAELARIDRDHAETQKLLAETRKFSAEQQKLMAEAGKFFAERRWQPVLAIVAAITGLIGGALGLATFLARTIQ
jgi:hypothetical protein